MDILLFYEWWEKDELLSWECLASIAWKCLVMPLMVSEQIAASARMKLGGIRAKTGLGYFRQTGPIVLTKQIHYRATEGLHPALRWDLLPLLEHDLFLWQPKQMYASLWEKSPSSSQPHIQPHVLTSQKCSGKQRMGRVIALPKIVFSSVNSSFTEVGSSFPLSWDKLEQRLKYLSYKAPQNIPLTTYPHTDMENLFLSASFHLSIAKPVSALPVSLGDGTDSMEKQWQETHLIYLLMQQITFQISYIFTRSLHLEYNYFHPQMELKWEVIFSSHQLHKSIQIALLELCTISLTSPINLTLSTSNILFHF